MAQILVNDLTFAYEGSYDNVFEHASFAVDTRWHLGLVGRNGRGKTTLLRLLQGAFPHAGSIDMPLSPIYFPFQVEDASGLTLFVMQQLARDAEEWQLRRELNLLRVAEDVLYRPYETLSKGEQTKVQLAVLFAREDTYPLIDEPTNHLDLLGRDAVADYLQSKDGFLLVSHDRAFLNRCIDHVLSINRNDITVRNGDYDSFERDMERQNQYEEDENQRLQRDIKRLTESARRTAQWSQTIEKSKYSVDKGSGAAYDKGYIGARSADMMKRALSTQRRQERAAEEKSQLLKNVEKVGELKLSPLLHPKEVLAEVREAWVRYGGKAVCGPVSFTLRQGQRLAILGKNGAGKSSILKTLCGQSKALEGEVRLASNLVISYVPQSTEGVLGDLRSFLAAHQLDETLFKAILRNMDFGREQFDKDLGQLSEGQKKKILLAKSLCEPAHLYVWDEPLNYIDILSRVQVERLLTAFQPTMLLVEHDRAFLERVCTGSVEI